MKKKKNDGYKNLYERLAHAIIVKAARDYIKAKSEITREDIRDFFRSDFFKVLTTLNPEMLIKKLDMERGVKNEG